MIAVDTNLLVYAHREDSAWHDAAYACIAGLAEGRAPWAVPWPCVHEFLAGVTHPRIYAPPTPLAAALDQVDAGCIPEKCRSYAVDSRVNRGRAR